MRYAKPIDAIDIDHWCYLNTLENIERNACSHITALEGSATLLAGKTYDLILANINRNILLKDLPTYSSCLAAGGVLLLSGFYKEDLPKISTRCASLGLHYVKNFERNNWVAVKYIKK
jgi:ribosomal protein L11 methyltransferase